jgi:hypothetical protein
MMIFILQLSECPLLKLEKFTDKIMDFLKNNYHFISCIPLPLAAVCLKEEEHMISLFLSL